MLYSAWMFTLLALHAPVPPDVALPPQSSGQPVLHLSQFTTVDLNRAKNYARQAIEDLNGGLGLYQAEDAMHGPSEESPYRDNGDGTWSFVFFGGEPGWTTPSIESEVTVDQGTGDVIVNYNGAIRNPEIVPADHQTPGGVVNAPLSLGITLNRAKNYARQAIEDLNGGLGLYQAEDVMHGPSEGAPYLDNGDGTWTFVFFGGAPGWTTPTIESEVTVNQSTGEVVVDYNGSPR
ncbi:MAG: purine nucleoside permease [Prochlorotrichaceae cyanobacterium]|jgi:hypothetical protein